MWPGPTFSENGNKIITNRWLLVEMWSEQGLNPSLRRSTKWLSSQPNFAQTTMKGQGLGFSAIDSWYPSLQVRRSVRMATAGLSDYRRQRPRFQIFRWTLSTFDQWYSQTSNYATPANDTVFGLFSLEFEGTHNWRISNALTCFKFYRNLYRIHWEYAPRFIFRFANRHCQYRRRAGV